MTLESSCARAHEHLSARLDGIDIDVTALDAHLAACEGCRRHARELALLRDAFEHVRTHPEPVRDLWPELERRLRLRGGPARRAPVLLRAAAALAGFLGVSIAARLLDASRPGPSDELSAHLLERFLPRPEAADPFLALPEYRLLRALPAPTTPTRITPPPSLPTGEASR